MKKLIIAGGSGFLGQELCNYFKNDFDKIIILARGENKSQGKITFIKWDAKTFGSWCDELENATAIINLCGKSVDCRYTYENKALIFSSRLDSTKIIGDAILKCKNPPKIWMNGASATIYPNSFDKAMGESSGEIGEGFSVEVCKAWEKVFNEFALPATRKINLRISLVLGKTGGVLPVMVKMTKRGLGGTMGSGKQQFSWIHITDFCRIIAWMIENENAKGPYNIVAPNAITNKNLMALFRKKVKMPIGLPATEWMLKIGAFIIGTETELVLKSRYVVPERLLNEGFKFEYETIEECLDNLVK